MRIFNKIGEKLENFKILLIIFMIKILFENKNREFAIRWTELKLGIIEKDQFDKWVTRQILDD